VLAELFGVKRATATIARISRDGAARFNSLADTGRDRVPAAPVRHMDKTGSWIGSKTWWLHITATIWLTFYRIAPQRGVLPDAVTGSVAHGHWKPYGTLNGMLHALCNTHHRRDRQERSGVPCRAAGTGKTQSTRPAVATSGP